jgi:glyoxylase-like metal-dependent hydrolase (beta-lactamase superfamily II)
MLGLEMPDVDRWSDRVVVALGQNPGAFTGPGTNTYLIGTGAKRILLDPGDGREAYWSVLERALERAEASGIEAIVLTHGHPDHIGGVEGALARHGPVPIYKYPWPGVDERYPFAMNLLEDGAVVRTEGATLRAVFTPGHCQDHCCFVLEEEGAIFSGDNVLGVGTTVIPARGGSLLDYMASLERIESESPTRIYPAHGPVVEDGRAKVREYIEHRLDRERQILEAMDRGAATAVDIVRIVYAAYPEALHAAAGQSVTSHLLKLEAEGRARRDGGAGSEALSATWSRA